MSVLLAGTLINIRRGLRYSGQRPSLLGGALPLSGSCPLGWGTALVTVTDVAKLPKVFFLFPFCIFFGEYVILLFQEYGFWFFFAAGYA